jgi:hypothetical protein
LEWIYKKDNSVSQGADGAWIDLIDFSKVSRVKYILRDLQVGRIVTPVQKEVYGQEPIAVNVLNLGRDTLNEFNLAYIINNKFPVVEHFKTKLPPNSDSVKITFDKRADMDMSGIYDITVFGYDNDDDYLLNDTLMIRVENTEIEESSIIFPNPFRDQLILTINSKTDKKVRLDLIDLSGRRILTSEEVLVEGENQITLDTKQIGPSMYILNIHGSSFSKSFPLLKIKH